MTNLFIVVIDGPEMMYLQLWLNLFLPIEGNEWNLELVVPREVQSVVYFGNDGFSVVVGVPVSAVAVTVTARVAKIIHSVLGKRKLQNTMRRSQRFVTPTIQNSTGTKKKKEYHFKSIN